VTATMARLKRALGCWLFERWKIELVLNAPALAKWMGLTWLDLCNRNETLTVDDVTGGRVCQWSDSSRLTAVSVFPSLGARISRTLLEEWPVSSFAVGSDAGRSRPAMSFLIPVGGDSRMAQFFAALGAARAQAGVPSEVVVVEQGVDQHLLGKLPSDVVYYFQRVSAGKHFNKSSALNKAARLASGDALVILDADYLLPSRFALTSAAALTTVEAARPARWILYLEQPQGRHQAPRQSPGHCIANIESIVSNNPTPIVVRQSTYWAIGGHDEEYEGWGGEDSEFLDRLRTRSISEGGWLPVWHLWHPPAAKKKDGDRNSALHGAKMAIPARQRIAKLMGALVGSGALP